MSFQAAHPRAIASPMSLAAAALVAALALPASAQTADSRQPVTDAQRQTADKVASAGVPLSELAPNAPESYTVKSGDTLWGISSMFLTSPWRWPELWGMNKSQVGNPHLIYPGQTLNLVRTADGRAMVQMAGGAGSRAGSAAGTGARGDTVRLSPRVRERDAESQRAISSIPHRLIEPFISQPMIVDANGLDSAPRIVASPDARVLIGRGDNAYARGVTDQAVERYHVFRPTRPLYDPDDTARKSPIAYEAFYLGTAGVVKRGEVTTLTVIESKQEMGVGDRLVPVPPQTYVTYMPRVPTSQIDGRIASVYSGVNQAGGGSVVTVNRGSRHGLEVGHVLALLDTGATITDRTSASRESVKLPDEFTGEVFVFRVFDNVSYALIMRTTKPVKVGDRVTPPASVSVNTQRRG